MLDHQGRPLEECRKEVLTPCRSTRGVLGLDRTGSKPPFYFVFDEDWFLWHWRKDFLRRGRFSTTQGPYPGGFTFFFTTAKVVSDEAAVTTGDSIGVDAISWGG